MTAALEIPTFADVDRAAERLKGVAHPTPVLTSRRLNEACGAELYFKCENLQRAGAFKFRGAFNAIAMLDPGARRKGVIAYSSGNHAQALALAGKLQGVSVTVVMPRDAPAAKIAAARAYGAEIHTYDRYSESREEIGRSMAVARGLTLIPPYDHPGVIAGQGTVARELFAETGPLDVLLVPLGGGGLLAGCVLAAETMAPECRIFGVEPAAGDDGRRSLECGQVVHIPAPRSIADGALVTHVGAYNFAIFRRTVEAIVTVTDVQLARAMRIAAETLKLVVEPTGALGLAAALAGKAPMSGLRVGIVISGGNVDLPTFAGLIAPSTPLEH